MTSYREINISPKFSYYLTKGTVKIKLKFNNILKIIMRGEGEIVVFSF